METWPAAGRQLAQRSPFLIVLLAITCGSYFRRKGNCTVHERKRLIKVEDSPKLRSLAEQFEAIYFKDFRFEVKELWERFFKYETQTPEDFHVDWDDAGTELLDEYLLLYVPGSRERYHARFDLQKREIQINSGSVISEKELGNALLHQMVHACQSLVPQALQQYLVLFLYERLSIQLGKGELDRIIRTNQHCIAVTHDLLFLLKSLDLDVARSLSLGTIIDYGREEFFETRSEL